MANRFVIEEIHIDEVKPGTLAERFLRGAAAIIIKNDPNLEKTWSDLVLNSAEQLPWCAPLVEIARNHCDGHSLGLNIGDMCYFTPGRLAYIARKFELDRESDTGHITCFPASFRQGGGFFAFPPQTIELCWSITNRIMQALIPATKPEPHYRVVVHRLKYQESRDDLDQLYALTKNMVGRWAQLGHKIDARRELANGPLSYTGVSDLFAVLGLISPFRPGVDALNEFFGRGGNRRSAHNGSVVIGKPHFDGRYFSGLCGSRDVISTEILVNDKWIELPIEPYSIAVLPGLLAKPAFGLQPVLHRVLHKQPDQSATEKNGLPNITLLFGTK